MHSVTIYPINDGFGYNVYKDDVLVHEQPHDRHQQGKVPFATEALAQACADELIAGFPVPEVIETPAE